MEYFGEKIETPILDLDLIRQLVSLVEREDLSELIVSQGEITIVVKGKNYRHQVQITLPSNLPQIAETENLSPSDVETKYQPAHVPTVSEERLFHITAPLTGIFYSRPRPDAPPFVTVGSVVEPDQVVALVEA
ncbi:MAG: hypothetical protein NZ937_08500, partial [Armatimonadetes bacterium]|nr:hypothetical protein [Armatimonadota bacterium]